MKPAHLKQGRFYRFGTSSTIYLALFEWPATEYPMAAIRTWR